MLLDVVILPPYEIRQRLARAALKANKIYPSQCVIDNVNLIPHISLYHFDIKKEKLSEVFKTVKQIVTSVRPFLVTSSQQKVGSISVEVAIKSLGILALNKKVIKQCAPLRQGIMPYTFKYKLTPAIKSAIKNHGTVGTVVNYQPHITLLLNMSGFGAKMDLSLVRKFSFKASVVAVCQINRWYQVTKILKKFRV